MTVQPIEYERPTWRDVNISKLAGRLYAAHMQSNFHDAEMALDSNSQIVVEAWWRAAEAAVDMLIDEPEREFQAQLQAVLNASESVPGSRSLESKAAREWREAKANDWLPEHA